MKGKVSFEEIDGVCITADFGGKRIEDYVMSIQTIQQMLIRSTQ